MWLHCLFLHTLKIFPRGLMQGIAGRSPADFDRFLTVVRRFLP
jgi:hypothetical protein